MMQNKPASSQTTTPATQETSNEKQSAKSRLFNQKIYQNLINRFCREIEEAQRTVNTSPECATNQHKVLCSAKKSYGNFAKWLYFTLPTFAFNTQSSYRKAVLAMLKEIIIEQQSNQKPAKGIVFAHKLVQDYKIIGKPPKPKRQMQPTELLDETDVVKILDKIGDSNSSYSLISATLLITSSALGVKVNQWSDLEITKPQVDRTDESFLIEIDGADEVREIPSSLVKNLPNDHQANITVISLIELTRSLISNDASKRKNQIDGATRLLARVQQNLGLNTKYKFNMRSPFFNTNSAVQKTSIGFLGRLSSHPMILHELIAFESRRSEIETT